MEKKGNDSSYSLLVSSMSSRSCSQENANNSHVMIMRPVSDAPDGTETQQNEKLLSSIKIKTEPEIALASEVTDKQQNETLLMCTQIKTEPEIASKIEIANESQFPQSLNMVTSEIPSASTTHEQPVPTVLCHHHVPVPGGKDTGARVTFTFQQHPQPVSPSYHPNHRMDSTLAGKKATDARERNYVRSGKRFGMDKRLTRERTGPSFEYFIDCQSGFLKLVPRQIHNDTTLRTMEERSTIRCVGSEGSSISNKINIERTGEATCSKEKDNVLSVSDRVEIELKKSLTADSACEEAVYEVESVFDRIEVELRKSMNSIESKTATTGVTACEDVANLSESPVIPRNTFDHRHVSDDNNTAMSVSRRIEMELPKSLVPRNTFDDRSVSTDTSTAMSVSQRIEMELFLGEVVDQSSVFRRNFMGDNFHEDHDGKKDKKDGQSTKQIPQRPPGLLTFTDEDLYSFLIDENSENEFTCKNCKLVFANKDGAKSHVNVHSPYRCLSCDVTFPTVKEMRCHYRREHREILNCTYCLYRTKRRTDFDRHVKTAHKQSTFTNFIQMVCYICGLSFRVWEPLDDHMEKEHGIEKTAMEGDFQCPLCNVISRSDQSFRDHMRKHKGDYYQCPHPSCDFQSVNQSCARKHYDSVHMGTRKYCCPFQDCGTSFKNGAKLNDHLNVVHYKIRKYFCDTCGKGFMVKHHLSVHERIHSDSKPIACKFCDYRCRQTASLKWHMKQTHPEMVSSEANPTSTSDLFTTHRLKRGRKPTGKRRATAARKQKHVLGYESYTKVKPLKKRNDFESGSDSEVSHTELIFQDSDSRDELKTSDGISCQKSCQDEDVYSVEYASTDEIYGRMTVEMEPWRRSSRKRRKTARAEAYACSMLEDEASDLLEDSCDSESHPRSTKQS